uniref:Uncharacterized protein n=1 Tax=Anguilla anguilla TaxID=7936 RepID=A0A0E9T4J9_ANGAN
MCRPMMTQPKSRLMTGIKL